MEITQHAGLIIARVFLSGAVLLTGWGSVLGMAVVLFPDARRFWTAKDWWIWVGSVLVALVAAYALIQSFRSPPELPVLQCIQPQVGR